MIKHLIKYMEKRPPLESVNLTFPNLLQADGSNHVMLTEEGFSSISTFLEKGQVSYRSVAVQIAAKWSIAAQRIALRNVIKKRGLDTPSAMWAYMQLRGNPEDILQEYDRPELILMQIILLKEVDPAISFPFIVERYYASKKITEELRTAARLCLLRLLDAGINPDLIAEFKKRFPDIELLNQWRPSLQIPKQNKQMLPGVGNVDFHQLVRSIHDVKDLSSLTRIVYLLSGFFIPLNQKQLSSLWLSKNDHVFFERLLSAGMIEAAMDGYIITPDGTQQAILRRFLYDSYPMVKDTVTRNNSVRVNEERENKVKSSELDRAALDLMQEGVICVDKNRSLYYINAAANKMLSGNCTLRECFGNTSIEEDLKQYSKNRVISHIENMVSHNGEHSFEIFGHRATITIGQKRFELELGNQIVLIKDITNQFIIDKEINSLYRHELNAALEVLGLGIQSTINFINSEKNEDALECLNQLEKKRNDLSLMLQDKMDFIRLHSDSFRIKPHRYNVNLILEKCVDAYRGLTGPEKVSLITDHLNKEALYLDGEERFLLKAIDNILRNAFKFAPAKSTITVTLQKEKQNAVIKISDKGPGIARENLDRIFNLGFTTNGSGRGLYIAKRIIIAHNGRIDVKSRPGAGATFIIKLPIQPET